MLGTLRHRFTPCLAWPSGLRILCCHSCGLGHNGVSDLIPGLGIPCAAGWRKEKKREPWKLTKYPPPKRGQAENQLCFARSRWGFPWHPARPWAFLGISSNKVCSMQKPWKILDEPGPGSGEPESPPRAWRCFFLS